MLPYILLLTAASFISAAKEDFLNLCMNGTHHKIEPGPEDDIHGQCAPWKSKSCCTANTSQAAHQDQSFLYSFNWDHCGIMTDECKKHFIQDTCFYECSPNLGPWIELVNQKWRKERILAVPLCKEDCEGWYDACRYDYTCMDNWHKGWEWASGTNECPVGKPCRKFTDIFLSAKDFCEKVWSNSYKFTESVRGGGRCMQLWFNNDDVAPNAKVAEYYAELKASARCPHWGLLIFWAPLFTLWGM